MIDVMEAPFAFKSVLFWSASLRSGFERFELDANCPDAPSPEMDIAVDSEPCMK